LSFPRLEGETTAPEAPAGAAADSTGIEASAVRAAIESATRRVNIAKSFLRDQLESARARRAALSFEAYDSPW
jgi:hypothetical protein